MKASDCLRNSAAHLMLNPLIALILDHLWGMSSSGKCWGRTVSLRVSLMISKGYSMESEPTFSFSI